jgi:hypothetical protein
MVAKYRIILSVFAICGALVVGGCEAEEAGETRSDLVKLGGKADVPEWLRHIPANWGCGQTLTGQFNGFDSAHLYSFAGKIGYEYTFAFEGSYSWYRGAVVAVYDAETGDRVAIERRVGSNKAKLVFEAQKNVKYLVAVYSVWWRANGSYTLSAACDLTATTCTDHSQCAKGEYCKMPLCGQPKGATGSCEARGGGICPEVLEPVCGCDGKDYTSPCDAAFAGANVAHTGYCPTLTAKTSLGNVDGTIDNRSFESIFLAGCSPLALQKKQSGSWVDQGPLNICVWEGYAQELAPAKSWTNSTQPLDAGTYRFVSGYSIGCKPGTPLSTADCLLTRPLFSDEFVVGQKQCWGAWLDQQGGCRTPADGVYPDSCCAKQLDTTCTQINNDYVKAVSDSQQCSPVATAPQCQFFAQSDLFCASCARAINVSPEAAGLTKLTTSWADLRCHRVPRMCPAYNCPKPAGATCEAAQGSATQGSCQVHY